MQTSPAQRTKRSSSKARSSALPRPELPEHTDKLFSLAWYFRKQTEREALEICRAKDYKKRSPDRTLTYALTAATSELEREVNSSIERVRKEGALLLAHADTRTFSGAAA